LKDIRCGENIYAQEIGIHSGMKILPIKGFYELHFLAQGFRVISQVECYQGTWGM
jgi:hypothetical protein